MPTDTLKSGRAFEDVFEHTMRWLLDIRYTHSYASHARERAVLTDKALWAVNAVPERLGQRLGSQLIDATKQGSSDEGKRKLGGIIGEFFGSALGATIKSLGGGA